MTGTRLLNLPDASDEEKVARWNRIELMLETPGWQDFRDAVDAALAGKTQALTTGRVRDDAASYERTIGEMRGLGEIEGIIEGLRARAEEARSVID